MSQKRPDSPPEAPSTEGRTTSPFWKVRIDDLERTTAAAISSADLLGDPFSELLDEMEARRAEEDRALSLAGAEDALGRLRVLRRRAMEFAASFPNVRDYEWFLREAIIPEYNRLFTEQQLCAECGGVFFPRDAQARRSAFCSDDCRHKADERTK
jgi:hypothetical protein